MPTDAADNSCPVIITIDGPAGTGKSTVAHMLARRLGLEFLDTGAMYRATALVALDQNIDPGDGPALAAAVREISLHFDWGSDPPRVMVGDRDVSRRIRDLDVAEIVSIVAAQPEVRQVLVEQQRRIAADHPRLVTEGRDQGSVVFPEAGARFYIDAAIDIRADRRARQLIAAGMDVDHERIVQGIIERDRIDSSRSDGPLIRPQGAIAVETSDLTAEQVVDELERLSRECFPDAGIKS
ncbi:MAG: (d)CMP kinase [Planctomycetota bacterium]|jgi:cytidylate kinase